MIKFSIILLVSSFALSGPAFAQLQTEKDGLPDITELPALELTPIDTVNPKPVDITMILEKKSDTDILKPQNSIGDIPADQLELINRLKYKNKEGSGIKKYKPEFGLKTTGVEVGASQKEQYGLRN